MFAISVVREPLVISFILLRDTSCHDLPLRFLKICNKNYDLLLHTCRLMIGLLFLLILKLNPINSFFYHDLNRASTLPSPRFIQFAEEGAKWVFLFTPIYCQCYIYHWKCLVTLNHCIHWKSISVSWALHAVTVFSEIFQIHSVVSFVRTIVLKFMASIYEFYSNLCGTHLLGAQIIRAQFQTKT